MSDLSSGVPSSSSGPAAAGDSNLSAPEGVRPLSQVERIADTYVAPSKTFADIRRNASWWAPYLLSILVSLGFMTAVSQRIGWTHVGQNTLEQSPQQQQRLESMPPAQQEATARQVGGIIKVTAYATPLIALIFLLVVAAVLLASINFLFGGHASFPQMFAMVNYAYLPNVLKYLLATLMLYVAPDPDHFNLQNPVGTNLGFYLAADAPKWLVALASSLDVVTIWIVVLLVIGCAIIGRVKRGHAALAVVGWWVITVVLGAAWAALRS